MCGVRRSVGGLEKHLLDNFGRLCENILTNVKNMKRAVMEQIKEMTAKIGEVSLSMVDNVEKQLKVCSIS